MRAFTYERADHALAAVQAVAATPGAKFVAGGTNLLDLMKLQIERPVHLVDVGRLPLAGIEEADGGLRIGAMATNSQVAADPRVRGRYRVLAQALLAGGSPQLRNKATTGGNLMQRTRCAYFYDPSKPCNKRRPGEGCSALEGLNRNSAILGASDACVATHASDMAVALAALDARVEVLGTDGALRTLDVVDFHRLPGETPHLETDLGAAELITAVILPPPAAGGQIYRKVRDRASYAGGLASVAVAGGRVALGAVAHKPWRARRMEAALADGASPAEAIGAEMVQARALGRNGFKVVLTSRLAAAAFEQAGGGIMTSVEDWKIPNPVTENRSGLIGKGVERYEGRLKVTGTAPYAYEVEPPAPAAYGYILSSTIACGRVLRLDVAAAEAMPGVHLVWTHRNAPAQGERMVRVNLVLDLGATPCLVDDRVHHFGETVALVVADSLEAARAAAQAIEVDYEAETAATDFGAGLHDGEVAAGQPDVHIGDVEAAFASAPVTVDGAWTTPIQNHTQMEPCATTAWWDGDTVTVHTSTQMISGTQHILAATLQIPPAKVRLLSRYVGGGFGGKAWPSDDLALAAMAARALGRPVKVAFTRQQMFQATPHRAATRQRVRLAANRDGQLTAIAMEVVTHGARLQPFTEPAGQFSRRLYAAPNRQLSHRLVTLDLPLAGPMRAPGEAVGMLSLECAMDELAEKLGMDPLELRLRNEPSADPETGKPFSSRRLVACLREGAQRFGWEARRAIPGQVRDGRWRVGMGMAAAIRDSMLLPAKADVGVDAAGVVTLRQGMTDIGTGTYTILAQITAETLGVPLEQVRIELGDSDFPATPGSGGQFGAATAGSAALAAGMKLRSTLTALAVGDPASPLYGGDPAAVIFGDGNIALANRTESLAALVARAAPQGVRVEAGSLPPRDAANYSHHVYGAHFVEVGVDADTGEVRLRRMFGAFAAGRILNAKTARSQVTGAMIWGVGGALTEGNAVDARFGSFINQDMGGYLVPTHADIVDLDAIFVEETDDKANAMGAKGLGELGICGAGAAVANAVYNATGVRCRDYPITPDKLLEAMGL